MPIQHPQPPIINGTEYPFLGVSLALDTRPENGSMILTMVAVLTPYRVTSTGIDVLEEGQKVFAWGNALADAASDPALAQFLGSIEAAGQQLVRESF